MKHWHALILFINLVIVTPTVFALEPLFTIKIHDHYLLVNGNKIKSINMVSAELKKLESPNEVFVQAHACLNSERLNNLINHLIPNYKPHLSVYGAHTDSDCK